MTAITPPPMPDAIAVMYSRDDFAWAPFHGRLPDHPFNIYTAGQLSARDQQWLAIVAEARAAAFEEAAKACEQIETDMHRAFKRGRFDDRGNTHTEGQSDGAAECAAAIRLLMHAKWQGS